MNPTKNGGKVKLTIRLNLAGCHFGQDLATRLSVLPLTMFNVKDKRPDKVVR